MPWKRNPTPAKIEMWVVGWGSSIEYQHAWPTPTLCSESPQAQALQPEILKPYTPAEPFHLVPRVRLLEPVG